MKKRTISVDDLVSIMKEDNDQAIYVNERDINGIFASIAKGINLCVVSPNE